VTADAAPARRNRRQDRVLAAEFVGDLPALPLTELRSRRAEAEQEEADLSYLRRLLQGRIDIIRAELSRRGGDGATSLVDQLPQILAESRAPSRGLGRHLSVEPSNPDSHRRHVEALVADVDLSNVGDRSDDELRGALSTLEREEHDVSAVRRRVQEVADTFVAELSRRYRDGEADVASLLTPPDG
jgi:hypothetical protein